MTEICLISHLHKKINPDSDASFRSAEARKQPRVGCNGHIIIRGHKGQSSAGTRCRYFQNSAKTRCRGFIIVLESRCRGFSTLDLDAVAFCPLKKCLGITKSWVICLYFPMSRFFGLVISMSWLFGLGISMSWYMMCLHGLVFVSTKSINMAHNFTIKLTK